MAYRNRAARKAAAVRRERWASIRHGLALSSVGAAVVAVCGLALFAAHSVLNMGVA